ncbi:MAG: hypothetical protein KKA73_28340 [Chloroflexi bacterium]|nr:hypothetical protein [Chloroflexota bacterium]MBU1751604.1 hypothetical protein [Chloroflexota bacterium]
MEDDIVLDAGPDVPQIEPLAGAPADALARPAGLTTWTGNIYDLAGLGALAGGLLSAFLCLTMTYGAYCLPLLPLILGIVGVAAARRAEDEQRTRTFAWIGLGIGGGVLVLLVLCVLSYVLFYVFVMGSVLMLAPPEAY